MATARAPAVAGTFYPASPKTLQLTVTELLKHAPEQAGPVKALIVPHAGYIYSGPVAASAYATLRKNKAAIRRVVLFGPAHRVYVPGICIPTVNAFETPLGSVPLDRDALDKLAALPGVVASDEPHRLEHSLEVQLPFLQVVLDDFTLIPAVVGDADPALVSEALQQVWGGPETLIVISSDLSHYHSYEVAKVLDAETSKCIETLSHEKLRTEQACGAIPVGGLLRCGQQLGLSIRTLDLRNSGDTAGPRDQVVGYGAYALS